MRVRAAPVEGAANEAVVRLLADALGVSRAAIRLLTGSTGRRKLVQVEGVDSAGLDRRWPAPGDMAPADSTQGNTPPASQRRVDASPRRSG